MDAVIMKHFDTLAYVKKSKELGSSEPLAEYQARQIEQAIDIAVNVAKEDLTGVATKLDIKELEISTKLEIKELEKSIKDVEKGIREVEKSMHVELKSLEIKLLKIYAGGFLIILGVLAKGFHWV